MPYSKLHTFTQTLITIAFALSYSMQCNAEELGKNMVQNGQFDTQLSDWSSDPFISWSPQEGSNASPGLVMTAEYKAKANYIYQVSAKQCLNINNANTFLFKAHFKYIDLPAKPYGHRANIVWHDGTDCTGGGQFGAYIQPNLSLNWQDLSKNNIRAALNAKSVSIELTQNQGSSAIEAQGFEFVKKRVYKLLGIDYIPELAQSSWDNIELIPIKMDDRDESLVSEANSELDLAIGVNYIKNASFSGESVNWNISSDYLIDENEGFEQVGALRTTISSSTTSKGTGAFSQCINFGSARVFEMGIMFKRDPTSTQSGGGRLRPTWYENEDCQGRSRTSNKHADPSTVDGWQKLVVTDLSPAESSRSVSVFAIQSIENSGEFSIFWDDAYFKAIGD